MSGESLTVDLRRVMAERHHRMLAKLPRDPRRRAHEAYQLGAFDLLETGDYLDSARPVADDANPFVAEVITGMAVSPVSQYWTCGELTRCPTRPSASPCPRTCPDQEYLASPGHSVRREQR